MQNVIDKIEWMFAGLGGFLGWFFGGFDGFLYALVVFVVCDYFTGVLAAAIKHELSSEVGFKGIAKKVCIFVLVGIANIIDTQILQNGAAIRTAVVFFYLANEGLSCLENAAVIGLPVPEKLKEKLTEQLDYMEDYWEELEGDYERREKAIEWMKQLPAGRDGTVAFLNGVTEEYCKAFLLSITIHSPLKFTVHWFDDTKTEVEMDSNIEDYRNTASYYDGHTMRDGSQRKRHVR